MTYSSYSNLNTLGEVSFIGGTTFYLDFKLKDLLGNYIQMTDVTLYWKMSPYGMKSVETLSKTGIPLVEDETTIRISLAPEDTENLSGKYIQQVSLILEEDVNAAWELINSENLTSSTQSITSGITQPLFPRHITVQSESSLTIGTVGITGTDENDDPITENISLSGLNRISGEQEFKTITQIDYPIQTLGGELVTVGGGSYSDLKTYILGQGIVLISPKIGV